MKKLIAIIISVILVFATVGCSAPTGGGSSYDTVRVVVEDSDNYKCARKIVEGRRGGDITFEIIIGNDDAFTGVDYPDFDYEQTVRGAGTGVSVTLRKVKYSTVVRPVVERGAVKKPTKPTEVLYSANDASGRTFVDTPSNKHLRYNTPSARRAFGRDGYIQIGWNTEADGGGRHIGFGSRHDRGEWTVLYAEWAKESSDELFEYEISDGVATVTKYVGGDGDVVIPRVLGGAEVGNIASDAFRGVDINTLVFPDTLRDMQSGAFRGVTIKDLYIFDNMTDMSPTAFIDYTLVTLHVNAYRNPGYCGSYFDVFPDKCDRLITLADKKKIVLACGSSARFGYDSRMIDEAFPEYEVVNMGVYAYENMLPQYLIIENYMREGDVLFSTPEFDTIETQFCINGEIDYVTFAMVESNYDLFSVIDCRDLDDAMKAYASHVLCGGSESGSYDISAYDYDEDFVDIGIPSYNEYGDYIVPRPNNIDEVLFGTRRACFNVRYFPQDYIDAINGVYGRFLDRGVKVLFGYSPRSRTSVTEDSDYWSCFALDGYFRNNLVVPVVGRIEDCLMSAYYFYATDNHLSSDGVKIHTAQVIEDLKEFI